MEAHTHQCYICKKVFPCVYVAQHNPRCFEKRETIHDEWKRVLAYYCSEECDQSHFHNDTPLQGWRVPHENNECILPYYMNSGDEAPKSIFEQSF